jgi:hypothetical protein
LEFTHGLESDSGSYRVVVSNSCGAVTSAVADVLLQACFYRGDANLDGNLDVADPVRMLEFLFKSVAVSCIRSLDANDSESVNIADAVYLLAAMFTSGPLPPAPYGACGIDPTPGSLSCDSFPPCEP